MEMRIPGRAIIAFSVGAALLCPASAVLATCEGGPCVCYNRCHDIPDTCPPCGDCEFCDWGANGEMGGCVKCEHLSPSMCCVEGVCCDNPGTDCPTCEGKQTQTVTFQIEQPTETECIGSCGVTVPYGITQLDVGACRDNACDAVEFWFNVVIMSHCGVCDTFIDISSAVDPDLNWGNACIIAALLIEGNGCFGLDGNHYCSSSCIAIHEANHEQLMEERIEYAMSQVQYDEAMQPLPPHCGDNSCASAMNSRESAIRSAVLNAWIAGMAAYNAIPNKEEQAEAAAYPCFQVLSSFINIVWLCP